MTDSAHIQRSIAVADRVVSLVQDGLGPIDRTIASWPAEFRVIIWEAVADTASRRAEAAKSHK